MAFCALGQPRIKLVENKSDTVELVYGKDVVLSRVNSTDISYENNPSETISQLLLKLDYRKYQISGLVSSRLENSNEITINIIHMKYCRHLKVKWVSVSISSGGSSLSWPEFIDWSNRW